MKKIFLLQLIFICIITAALAQAPAQFNYQGIARSSAGLPLASQSLGLSIIIHDGSATGATVYQETQTATTNAYGLYNVQIGAGTVVSGTLGGVTWATGNKFIQVQIDPTGGTNYTDLGTNQLLSVPYAMYANASAGGPTGPQGPIGPTGATGDQGIQGVQGVQGDPGTAGTNGTNGAQGVQGIPGVQGATGPAGAANINGTANYVVKFTDATTGGNSLIYDNGTNVGIGTTAPNANAILDVPNASTSNGSFAIHATSGSAAGVAVSNAAALYGESSTGIGVVGASTSYPGVFGVTDGIYGAVEGQNLGSGSGVAGYSNTGTAGLFDGGTSGYGVLVPNGAVGINVSAPVNRLSVATTGTGIDTNSAIYGYNNNSISALKGGVFGQYNGNAYYGAGVVGLGFAGYPYQTVTQNVPDFASATSDVGVYGSGNTAGVVGTSPGLYGVAGYSTSQEGTGVIGNASGPSATGVEGYATGAGAFGVQGYVTSATSGYAIYCGVANAGTNIYAGYFSGKVAITGTLSKGGGSFKIDDPLDPANKYLYHSFVESPDMMNIYNGNITTDADGYATVTMPDYFDMLNKDFRYQLTVIGTFAQAIVKEEMDGNHFKIQTSQPNVKVSWQVTGVRKDDFANAHRIPNEEEKEPEFKGLYLYPTERGLPASMGIDYKIQKDHQPAPATKGKSTTSQTTPPPTTTKPASNATSAFIK